MRRNVKLSRWQLQGGTIQDEGEASAQNEPEADRNTSAHTSNLYKRPRTMWIQLQSLMLFSCSCSLVSKKAGQGQEERAQEV